MAVCRNWIARTVGAWTQSPLRLGQPRRVDYGQRKSALKRFMISFDSSSVLPGRMPAEDGFAVAGDGRPRIGSKAISPKHLPGGAKVVERQARTN